MELVQKVLQFGDDHRVVPKKDFRFFCDLSTSLSPEQVPEKVKELVLSLAEQALQEPVPMLLVRDYMAYRHNGNRVNYEGPYFNRRNQLFCLALGEWLEQKGRFTQQLIDYLWAILEESTWVVPAHNFFFTDPLPDYDAENTRNIDLFCAETGSLLAWVYFLVGDVLAAQSERLLPRIRKQVKERLLDPFVNYSDMFWMGTEPYKCTVNNWNPWVLSNLLTIIAVFCEDTEERQRLCARAAKMLACFPAGYHSDGGCDEGPSYWGKAGASFFDCCELLCDLSGGSFSPFDDPLLQNMGAYVQKAYIAGGYYLNFADAPGTILTDPILIARFGHRCGLEQLERFGSLLFHREDAFAGNPDCLPYVENYWSLYRMIKDYFTLPQPLPEPELPRATYLDGIQVCVLRETDREREGFYLAAKGGHNAENHNHNDVGNFVVYHNGAPVLFDLGVGTYTRFTFDPATRYQIFTMNSTHHNLPEVDGVPQATGLEYRAANASFDPEVRCFSLDIAPAYPEKAGIRRWQRSFSEKEGVITLIEDFQLDHPGAVVLHLVCLEKPEQKENALVFPKAGVSITCDFDLAFSAKELPLEDPELFAAWKQEAAYLLSLSPAKPAEQGILTLRMARL